MSNSETKASKCFKCNGVGRLSWTSRDDGLCYACNGTGELEHGATLNRKPGLFEFEAGGLVWQFETVHHGEDAHYAVDPKGCASVDSILFQVVKGSGRRGRTVLRARRTVEVGRKAWRDAKAGMDPLEMDNAYLGDPGRCAVTRDRRGVEWL